MPSSVHAQTAMLPDHGTARERPEPEDLRSADRPWAAATAADLLRTGAGGAEPVSRDGHPDRLMPSSRVVMLDPPVDRGLHGSQVGEGDGVVEELPVQALRL